jgi:hypothetical protein
MKNKIVYLFVLLFTLFCISITGCSGTPVPYSFAENEKENGTAIITFEAKRNTGVDLFYFENVELPIPVKNRYWSPVTFPAGRPFELTVKVYYDQMDIGNVVKFKCPALIAGNNYSLSIFIIKEKKFLFNTIRERSEKLILINTTTKQTVYEQQVR